MRFESPPHNDTVIVMHRVLTFPTRHPFIFGVGLTAAKTGTVDLLVQKYVEDAKVIDWRRTSIFTIFGMTYLGSVF
jgi:hypothetical protein